MRKKRARRKIPPEIFDIVEYNEDSPTGLVYKTDVYAGQDHRSICKRKGEVAGGGGGLRKNYYSYRTYCCHRIIWEMLVGEIPENRILDHIDGNRHNNILSNLRLSDVSGNAQNMKRYSTNTSGKTGVYLNKHPHPLGRWCAVWKENGRILQKSFCISKYGNTEAFDMASKYRDAQIIRLNEQCGCDYTRRHGEVQNEE